MCNVIGFLRDTLVLKALWTLVGLQIRFTLWCYRFVRSQNLSSKMSHLQIDTWTRHQLSGICKAAWIIQKQRNHLNIFSYWSLAVSNCCINLPVPWWVIKSTMTQADLLTFQSFSEWDLTVAMMSVFVSPFWVRSNRMHCPAMKSAGTQLRLSIGGSCGQLWRWCPLAIDTEASLPALCIHTGSL